MDAKVTLIGMYQYLLNHPTNKVDLFGDINLNEAIDKDTLINEILMESGEFGVIYQDGYFLKNAITLFFDVHKRTFDKWVEAVNLEYNPLDNYDRLEEWSDNTSHSGEGTHNDSSSQSSSNESRSSSNGSDLHNVSAFDSNSYSPESQTLGTNSGEVSGSGNENSNSSGSTSESSTTGSTHSGRVHGNIGVTTSMQLVRDQLELVRFNIYEEIASLFVEDFCIMVY